MALVRFDRSLALASVAALALACSLSVSRPARALDDDGKDNVFNALLGMVEFTPHEAPEIDYRERPMLVVPPKMDLPAPIAPGAHRAADWPNDPDVLRRKKAAEEAKMPILGFNDHDATRPLTKDELLAHRGNAAPVPDHSNDFSHCSHGQCDWMKPQVLEAEGAAVNKAKDADDSASDILVQGTEPQRKYLSEPPKGYRKATATLKAPASAPVPLPGQSDNISSFFSNINPFKSDDDY
jgi:hypothetical protein